MILVSMDAPIPFVDTFSKQTKVNPNW